VSLAARQVDPQGQRLLVINPNLGGLKMMVETYFGLVDVGFLKFLKENKKKENT
jgi:hypothetical protein